MDTTKAAELITAVHFMPGWRFEAVPLWGDKVWVTAVIDTVNSDRENALRGYPQQVTIAPDTIFPVGNVKSENMLYAALLGWAVELWTHEAREFLRIGDAMDAPFHPHRPEGTVNLKAAQVEARQM